MKHVVYDCDNTLGVLFSDVDDGLALLYLLGEPETVDLLGITAPLVFSKNTMDELNFSCDPQASYDVLTKGHNVSVITGNNCLKVLFTTKEYREKLYTTKTSVGDFIRDKADLYAGLNESIFGIEGFYNWDVLAAAYLCHPEQFRDHRSCYDLSVEDLETGYLRISGDGLSGLNLPEVREAESFRDHIYGTWLSADIAYQSRNYLPLRAVKRVLYPVLHKAAAIYWNLGKMNVKFTGKGVNGHGA